MRGIGNSVREIGIIGEVIRTFGERFRKLGEWIQENMSFKVRDFGYYRNPI